MKTKLKNPKIAALELFNAKLERLRKGRFVKSLKQRGYGSRITFKMDGGTKVKRHGPSDEAIQAALLTVRFFIQDNESCSVRNLAKIYADPTLPDDLRNEFNEIRKILNDFLDTPGNVIYRLSKNPLTYRQIFDAVVYGDLAHNNPKKTAHYDVLFDGVFASVLSQDAFMKRLIAITKAVFMIGRINVKVLGGKYLV